MNLGMEENQGELERCLPQKLENLSLIPRAYVKKNPKPKTDLMVHACNAGDGNGDGSLSNQTSGIVFSTK